MGTITVWVNERACQVPRHSRVGAVRDRFQPGADVLVRNGCACHPEATVMPEDRIVLIRRGEMPSAHALEDLMAARHTPGVHRRVKQGVVAVAGLGGLGSTVAVALARVGVGTLILADHDVVEPSNLNRQQYVVTDIGRPKTEAMVDLLHRINPYLTYRPHAVMLCPDNIPHLFRAAQVVVECLDDPAQKAMLVESVGASLPNAYIVAASGVAGFGDGNRIQTRRLGTRLFVSGDLETGAKPGCGLMAPRVGIAACHQADLALSLLVDPGHVVP